MGEVRADPQRLSPEICVRALEARDPRFDGVFFVGITSTRIYCRPVCPARVSRPANRRFFTTAAVAERAGFRPCRRCRPELAPGRALVDAVPRLAATAARRIAAGALNNRPVRDLARELCVGERHLRRAMERELGVSPLELAQTHRLLLAKQLLTDTDLAIGQIAFAAGFNSLRRFNVLFRERYGLNPSALRRSPVRRGRDPTAAPDSAADGMVRLTLGYRPPLAWQTLLRLLARDALPGAEHVAGRRYARTIAVAGHAGVVIAEDARPAGATARSGQLEIRVSPALLPALMPLLAGIRHLFDLDAEPAAIDECLGDGGLAPLVARRPGLRIPGALCVFQAGLIALTRKQRGVRRVLTERFGQQLHTGVEGLDRLPPDACRIAEAGEHGLRRLDVPGPLAESLAALARLAAAHPDAIAPGGDVVAATDALAAVPGLDATAATRVLGRAMAWPDAFAPDDVRLQTAAGAGSAAALLQRAEAWRPWRAYAALHLELTAPS